MQIWECVTLFCFFMISPPHCRTSTIPQQNQTPLPASAIRSADVTIQPCGQPETNSKVQQDQKRTRGFPEGRSPLDPLSISPVKPKRNQKEKQSRRIKGSQKRRTGGASLQITTGRNGSLTEIRSGESASVDPTEKSNNTNQQRLEIASGTTAQITNTEKNTSGRTRHSKQGARPGFGLPVDRIGLGRLPSGRR
ncbi:osteocrin isoform 1-T1 [Clarias gariepinus]